MTRDEVIEYGQLCVKELNAVIGEDTRLKVRILNGKGEVLGYSTSGFLIEREIMRVLDGNATATETRQIVKYMERYAPYDEV